MARERRYKINATTSLAMYTNSRAQKKNTSNCEIKNIFEIDMKCIGEKKCFGAVGALITR